MRSFEKEYRKMIQEEVPDLWDRIEAGLADKEREFSGVREDREKIEEGKRTGGKRLWKYAGIAAACLCIAVFWKGYRLAVESRFAMGDATAEEFASEAAADIGYSQEEEGTAGSVDTAGGAKADTVDLEDGTVVEDVDVKIEEITQMRYHSLYRAVVVEDGNGVFHSGDELVIMAEDNWQKELAEGEIYCISVVYDSQSEVMFHFYDQ